MNPESTGSAEYEALKNEAAELRARVRSIEDALHRRGVVLEARAPEFAPRPQQMAEQPISATPPAASSDSVQAPAYRLDQVQTAEIPAAYEIPGAAPMFAASHAPSLHENRSSDQRSLESRIGSQWFNRIGILALLIAAAWFLKYAIDNHWIGPLGTRAYRPRLGRRAHRLVGALPHEGLRSVFLFAEGGGQRRALPVAVGGLLALPPAAGHGRLRRHDRGDGLQRLHGLGAGRGVAGALRDCRRAGHAAACSPPARTTKWPC
jgi:hypothetical protein